MLKDNSTFLQKAQLRRNALAECFGPVVMETHGGTGKLWRACYSDVKEGIVFESDPQRAAHLALDRPTWSVYEADCIAALRGGVGSHLAVNFLDLDPYGAPWGVLDAFFGGQRPRVAKLVVVVNDGLRQKIRLNGGWDVHSLRSVVDRFGAAAMHRNYLAICQELVGEKAATQGYEMKRWAGYYCGASKMMTHYAAVLERAV